MYPFNETQLQNMMLGQSGWDIILNGETKYGNWFTLRLVVTLGVYVNNTSLEALNLLWGAGLYFYGNITKIFNNSGYAILAYRTGHRLTYA